jgi:hypothetical protein
MMTRLIRGLVVITLFVFAACSKRGCLDDKAQNFEPKAKIDCGCCNYVGKVRVWYMESFYRTQLADLKRIILLVNGEKKTEYDFLLMYSSSPPDIPSDYGSYSNSSTNSIYINLEAFLGEKKQKKFKISMIGNDNRLLWEDSVMVQAAKVTPVEAH